jgi:hypothetical protein
MILGDLIEAIKDMFFTFLYTCFMLICQLIDFIKDIFYMLCGIDTVEVNGEQGDLLSSLVQSDTVKRSFLIIFVIGVILLVVFTIIAIVKANYQEKQSWASVLKKSGQSFVIALIIPFAVLAGILLTNTVMSSINLAMNPYGSTAHPLIGGQFLATIGSDSFIGTGEKDEVIAKFVSGELDYTNVNLVKSYFNIQSMNYLIGILGGFVMLVMFVLSSITFVQRIFDVILLYLVSPVSIATIPLDEGNRFKVWKDMMVGKILSAYGIILVMNLFFLIIPQVYQIRFFDGDFQNGIVYILFLIGGSFAISKANDIIARLCGSDAGRNELSSMIYNARSGMALAHSVNTKIGGAFGKLVGGSAYTKARNKGGTRKQALQASSSARVNEHKVSPKQKPQNKAQKILGGVTRFATMPAGMIHDLSQGGVIAMGKNFTSRLNNAVHGSSIVNHNDVMSKPKKDKSARTEAKGGTPGGSAKEHPRKVNSVMRKDDKERKTIGGRPEKGGKR